METEEIVDGFAEHDSDDVAEFGHVLAVTKTITRLGGRRWDTFTDAI